MVRKLKIHKSTLIFKISVFKLIEKYPKLMKSSVTDFSEELFEGREENLKKIQVSLNK